MIVATLRGVVSGCRGVPRSPPDGPVTAVFLVLLSYARVRSYKIQVSGHTGVKGSQRCLLY